MNHEEAVTKAQTPVQPAVQTANSDPYRIPFEMADEAKSLVGKTLRGPKGSLEITDWVGQNYVMRIGGADTYTVTPVMWVLQNLSKFQVI
jgi:hypothetical protein